MTQIHNSPLLEFIKKYVKQHGKKNITLETFDLAYAAVETVINECCFKRFPKKANPFLTVVYTELKSMRGDKLLIPKLDKIKLTIDFYRSCCL